MSAFLEGTNFGCSKVAQETYEDNVELKQVCQLQYEHMHIFKLLQALSTYVVEISEVGKESMTFRFEIIDL